MALFALSRHVSSSFSTAVKGFTLQGLKPARNFWAWLNSVANQIDNDRVKEVGPDRCCAEWLLKCGGAVKWAGRSSWEKDYNSLPAGNYEAYKVEEIDATGSTINALGFAHLRNLKHVKRIILHDCRYLYDDALEQLPIVKDTLVFLQLSNCGDISDRGLTPLTQLSNLKQLVLFALPEVKNPSAAEAMLKSALPNCNVQFTEARPNK